MGSDDIGDLWASGTFLKRSMKTRLSGAMVESDWEDATNYTGDESLNDFIQNTFTNVVRRAYFSALFLIGSTGEMIIGSAHCMRSV